MWEYLELVQDQFLHIFPLIYGTHPLPNSPLHYFLSKQNFYKDRKDTKILSFLTKL